VCNVMFHACNLQIVFFFFFLSENMPKATLGGEKKKGLSLHWRSEDIGDLYVKNVKTLN
jgi:hypothetical protein